MSGKKFRYSIASVRVGFSIDVAIDAGVDVVVDVCIAGVGGGK